MTKGILGKKLGMTQVFDEEGRAIPVTVIQAGPCVVVQKKTEQSDGYNAIQVGFQSEHKERRLIKPARGHLPEQGLSRLATCGNCGWTMWTIMRLGRNSKSTFLAQVKRLT